MHGSNVNAKILKMAELFQVSGQAMKICLASHNMGAVKKVPKKKGCDLAKKQDSSLFLWYN